MTTDDAFWVGLVACSIAAVCVAAIVVISVREKRRSGRWPREVLGGRGEAGWFTFVSFMWFFGHAQIPEATMRALPLCILVPGVDAALLTGFAGLAVLAMSWAFRAEWHWRTAFWITFHLVFPALFIAAICSDLRVYKSMAWVWIPAALVAIFAAPFCARFAYQEWVRRGQSAPDTSDQPDFRLWRPGAPQ